MTTQQREIHPSLDWLVIDDGKIVSAHTQPHVARAVAATQYHGQAAVLVQPGCGIRLHIGQRVRNDNGMAAPL